MMISLLDNGYAIAVAGLAPLSLLLIAAAWTDVRDHRIPNSITLGGAILALALHAALPAGHGFASALPGGLGFMSSLAGMAIGLIAMLPLYLLGATAAGDAKLMAMVGAYLGPVEVVIAVLATFLAGAVLAIAYAVRGGAFLRMMRNLRFIAYAAMARTSAYGGAPFDPRRDSVATVPYAVAIALGTCIWFSLRQYLRVNG